MINEDVHLKSSSFLAFETPFLNEHFDSNNCHQMPNKVLGIQSKLRNWALKENITSKALTSLLKVLKKFFEDLPIDSQTFLFTPRHIVLKEVEPDTYFYFGLRNCLLHFLKINCNFKGTKIDVVFNINGLPIAKSSTSQL